MSGESSIPCSHCGALAKQRCSGCKTTPYCNKTCQTEDWPSHRGPCRDLRIGKIVERAANTLQKVYFTFREQIFLRNVIKIERQGENLAIWEDSVNSKKKGGVFVKFPTDLIKDYDEYATVISCENLVEPLGYFYDLVRQMLPKKSFRIAVLRVLLKNKRLVKVYYHNSNPNSNPSSHDNDCGTSHCLLRITSRKTEKAWCIDVRGAQRGLTNPLWEWTEFYERHVLYVLYTLPFGQVRKYMAAISNINALGKVFVGISMRVAVKVNRAMASWCRSTGMTMFRMLQDLDDNSFAERQEEALAVVCNTARNYVEASDFSALAEEAARIRADADGATEWIAREAAIGKQLWKPVRFAM